MKASHVVIVLLTVWFLMIGAAAWAAYAVFVRPGMIEVKMSERDWDVKRSFTIYLPAGLANGAIRMTGVLDDVHRIGVMIDHGPLDVHWRGDREIAAMFAVLAEELETETDLRILEVHDGDEHVTVDVQKGELQIEVESWRESVRITVPHSTLRAALDVAEDLSY